MNIEICKHENLLNQLDQISTLALSAMGFLSDEHQVNKFTHYFYKRPNSTIAIAREGEKMIGAVSANPINTELSTIARSLLLLYRKKYLYSGHMLGFITVAKDYQNKGIGKTLLSEFVNVVKPSLLMAETKNPAAVQLIFSTLKPLRYRTFYNSMRVCSENDELKNSLRDKLDIRILETLRYQNRHIPLIEDVAKLPPNIPDLSPYQSPIKNAFESLVVEQTALGTSKSAVGVLISIKR